MRELILNVEKKDNHFANYVYKKMLNPVRAIGGICTLDDIKDKICLGIAINDECYQMVDNLFKNLIAEILAIGYKNKYLKENIGVDTSSLLGRVLLDTMCIFDSRYDAKYIKKQIKDFDVISLEGCYNFRLIDIKQKWDDIINLFNSYSDFLADDSIIIEFLNYLLNSIPCLYEIITVIVDDNFQKFELINDSNVVLSKFESFTNSNDVRESLLFNLICYNPNMVNLCVDINKLDEEFYYVLRQLFSVREFVPENN